MKKGRPSLYNPAYCDEVESFLAGGYSVLGFAGHIGVAESTIYEWAKNHEDFSKAVKAGQARAALWWEDRLRGIALDGGSTAQATSAIFGLKNRSRSQWADISRTELTGADGDAVKVETRKADELSDDELAAIVAKAK